MTTRFETLSALGHITVAIAMLFSSGLASAKCQTTELMIRSTEFAGPIIVAGVNTAGRFNIWNGPRVRMNNERIHLDPAHTRGNFVDWRQGDIVETPDETLNFQIAFFCRFDDSEAPQKVYSVDYAFSQRLDRGFIYLPGQDDSRYSLNVSSIVHGVEGGWYRSTDEWEEIIRPILVNAINK